MKLLLSGGGLSKQVKKIDLLFSDYVNGGKVLYIPVAQNEDNYEECFNWFKAAYKKFNITDIDMVTDLNNCDLSGYRAVFIGGGNTFKLLKEIKDSHFDIKLINYLNNGGFVYGGSAGAIIFGKNIKPAIPFDPNEVGLTDLDGLNLIGGYNVWCHYHESDNQFFTDYQEEMYLLKEEEGLYFNGDKHIRIDCTC